MRKAGARYVVISPEALSSRSLRIYDVLSLKKIKKNARTRMYNTIDTGELLLTNTGHTYV